MSSALENLNLEEGKSEALRAALAAVAESTSIDGGPRYSQKTCRDLARIITCRSYAKPVLELSHLLVVASTDGKRFEDIFWSVSRASSGEFRRAFMTLEQTGSSVRISGKGVWHDDGADGFQVTFSRMPLLAALLEFMVMTIGYPAIDDIANTLRTDDADTVIVLDVARALQRSLYAYLKDHLPPVQRQRRERHFLEYAVTHAGNRTGADVISDDIVLGYWKNFAQSTEIEAKTFRAVYVTARRLISALDTAQDRIAGAHAVTIGTDLEAGEIDPADLHAVVEALDTDEGPLEQLVETCGTRVKFLNLTEVNTFSELPLDDGTSSRTPVSVLRSAVFGAVQLRLSMALRRGEEALSEMPNSDESYYRSRISEYMTMIGVTEKLAMAALWALFCAGRAEAVDLALQLAPDIDWGQLAASRDDNGPDNVVSIGAVDAAKKFFEIEANARGDEMSALIADARRAWREVNRAGFQDETDDECIEVLAAAVPDVMRLIHAVRHTVTRNLAGIDWSSHEVADVPVFAKMFDTLYHRDEEDFGNGC